MKQLRFFFILMAWVCIHTAWGQVGTSSDPLYGKRIGVIGDSYVRNHREPVEIMRFQEMPRHSSI